MSAQPDVSLHFVESVAQAVRAMAIESVASDFVLAFLYGLPEDEMRTRSAIQWAALGVDFFAFASRRQLGKATVRIFNPDLDRQGFGSNHTVVEIINDDMPFLVDSVTMALAASNIGLHTLIHPILKVQRDSSGRLTGLVDGNPESVMFLEIDRQSPSDFAVLQKLIESALMDVRASVQDWQQMREKMLMIAEDLKQRLLPVSADNRQEAIDFLHWAAENHFTFLGYREYHINIINGERMLVSDDATGLGILRHAPAHPPRPIASLAAHRLRKHGELDVLILTKTNARATVHRPGYMDYIGVLSYDDQGQPIHEQRFLGLYTSSAYNRRPWDIPLVRRRHDHVMQVAGLAASSHSGKALRHVLETLPRDELFQSSNEELHRTAMGVLALQERVRCKLFLRQDRFGRFFSALVYIPRDRYNTDARLKIETLLREELNAERLDSTVQIGESTLAQLHLVIRPKTANMPAFDVALLEAKIVFVVRNWYDELRDSLINRSGEERGLKLLQRFARGLPAGYMEAVSPKIAAGDIDRVVNLENADDLIVDFYRSDNDQCLRVKTLRLDQMLFLSDALPMLENLGLRILSEHPYQLMTESARYAIQDFFVESRRPITDLAAVRSNFEQAFAAIWRGIAENDGFNRLVLDAGLSWRQVALLRSYAKYLQQVGTPFSQSYIEQTLSQYPLIARLLIELFYASFDPQYGNNSDQSSIDLFIGVHAITPNLSAERIESLAKAIIDAQTASRDECIKVCEEALNQVLETVSSLDEDRILRSFMAMIQATLRTNFYQCHKDANGHDQYRDYIAFKLDPSRVPDLPKPKPYREIFVYSPWVEGVHLRFGMVARGGLRWSDRREDFRTEVLGLVKAQMVKNTVIVPVGAKGGFFVKRPPASGDRDAILAEGIACYQRFINALLDITDNLVDGKLVPPNDVVRHDGDDPYLVVAADKGTATFSDIANRISLDRGFWLGDAFASGGSVGYDHKAMGITARGAWESVKRHFRALNIDCQSEDFTCTGIGDMSGDVFGNGMLLSQHIKLIAAFDHRHIFIDPSPDSQRSFIERQRLFKLSRSSWEDYDKSLISQGGGVYSRQLKHIALSAQAKLVLGIDETTEQLTPTALMNAILKAPVDLLWNGGIGTYIKAASETHADVGDRANNGLRVDGGQLRCRVIGEGGNLGVTQKGRIEAASAGVLLNTDFIDNSAGVDTSDHEVNIKILLNAITQRGDLSLPARNELLAQMTDEVAELVLVDNYRQNQAISLMQRMSAPRLGSFQHMIRVLESKGLLDRALEYLPSDAEFSERRARGQGLTRPELSTLLSYDKIVIFNQMLESDVPEDPYLSKELARYFPLELQKRYSHEMEQHRLRREIIATAVTNSMVNRMGATFVLRMQEDTGQTPAQIAKAYSISREITDARQWWAQIDGLDLKLEESAQIDALFAIWQLLRVQTRWLLNRPGSSLQIAAMVERYADPSHRLRQAMAQVLPGELRVEYQQAIDFWAQRGYPPELAKDFAALPQIAYGLDIVEIANARGLPVVDVAAVYFQLGEAMHTRWLMDQVELLPVEGKWHAQARGVMRDDLQMQQRALVGLVLASRDVGASATKAVEDWLSRENNTLRYTMNMLADMRNLRGMDYATLSVAVRRLAQIASASQE